MGGRSQSRQSTSNEQLTNNIVNDGDYAGVSGNVTHDESSERFEDSYNTDNSVTHELDYEDSFNTTNEIDNRIVNDGDFAGSSGDITVIDGNSLKVAENIAIRALDNNGLIVDRAFGFGESALSDMRDASQDALDAMESNSSSAMQAVNDNSQRTINSVTSFGNDAMSNMADVSDSAISNVADISSTVIDELGESTQVFSDNLSATTKVAMSVNSQILEQTAANNTQDKEIIAQLAKSTSLAGQDIVAKTSEKMTMYMAIAVAVIGLGVVAVSMRGKG